MYLHKIWLNDEVKGQSKHMHMLNDIKDYNYYA